MPRPPTRIVAVPLPIPADYCCWGEEEDGRWMAWSCPFLTFGTVTRLVCRAFLTGDDWTPLKDAIEPDGRRPFRCDACKAAEIPALTDTGTGSPLGIHGSCQDCSRTSECHQVGLGRSVLCGFTPEGNADVPAPTTEKEATP